MEYMCEGCGGPTSRSEAFVRAVSFRQVAWCPACWGRLHPALGIPAQRTAPAAERLEPKRPRRLRSAGSAGSARGGPSERPRR